MIWDVEFDGYNLKMDNMFFQFKWGENIVDIYGCFVFYLGLLCNGCLLFEDDYVLYGEMLCVDMD